MSATVHATADDQAGNAPAGEPAAAEPPPPAARRRSLPARLGRTALNVAMVAVLALAVVAVVGSVAGWWRFAVVLSGSMRPGIQPGDVEVLQAEPLSAVHVGQIVAFHPPHQSIVVTHRVIALTRSAGHVVIRTKGDANNVADPWGPVRLLGTTTWHVTHVIPKVGFFTVWAREPAIRFLALAVVVGILLALALRRIWARQ